MLNTFTVEGVVTEVQEKPRRTSGRWFLVTIDADKEQVPLALFGREPKVGDSIRVTGSLASWNGYVRTKVKEVVIGETSQSGLRIPNNRRQENGFDLDERGVPRTAHFEDDGGLPF